MKKSLVIFFTFVLISMLVVTSWASLQESVFVGGAKLMEQPWGIATLFDTYFGFLTFYVWVLYKEKCPMSRAIWLVLILALGNIAMASYVLWQIKKNKTGTFEGILLNQKVT